MGGFSPYRQRSILRGSCVNPLPKKYFIFMGIFFVRRLKDRIVLYITVFRFYVYCIQGTKEGCKFYLIVKDSFDDCLILVVDYHGRVGLCYHF